VRKLYLILVVTVVAILIPSSAGAQTPEQDVTPLSNKDVLFMVKQKLETEAIIKAIQLSPCTFDTFPPVLREMKRRGVGDAILQAMVEAPYGPSAERTAGDDLGEAPIYHYAEQLKQMGFLIPTKAVRGRQPTRQRARASRSRRQ
jgi:hypothetical protein